MDLSPLCHTKPQEPLLIAILENSLQPPFDNPENNDYFDTDVKTNIGQLDAFQYKENFGYEFDVLKRPRMNSRPIKQDCKLENLTKGEGGKLNWQISCQKLGNNRARAYIPVIEVRLYAAFVVCPFKIYSG